MELNHSWKLLSEMTLGAILLLCLTSIPAWINNHMASKVRDEITHPFSNFNSALLKFGNR